MTTDKDREHAREIISLVSQTVGSGHSVEEVAEKLAEYREENTPEAVLVTNIRPPAFVAPGIMQSHFGFGTDGRPPGCTHPRCECLAICKATIPKAP